jgi:hypothetical protein
MGAGEPRDETQIQGVIDVAMTGHDVGNPFIGADGGKDIPYQSSVRMEG